VQKQFYTGFVAVDVQVIDAAGVEGRGTTNDAVHGVTFSEQQFRQVGTVLSGYACLNTGSGRIKKQKERGQTMDFFVGGMKRIQFKKKTVVGVGKHAPVIKATLPGVLLAEDLGDAREAISFFVRVLGHSRNSRLSTVAY
jgi:hypothetical protein